MPLPSVQGVKDEISADLDIYWAAYESDLAVDMRDASACRQGKLEIGCKVGSEQAQALLRGTDED